MNVFLTGAIGDIFALESFFSNSFRANLTAVCYATNKRQPIETLFKALPNYKVNHITIWDDFTKFWCFTHKSQCQELMSYRNITPSQEFLDAEDFGIEVIFPKAKAGLLRYNNSSWLIHKVCDINLDLPSDYFVICPYGSQAHENRNFSISDWQSTINFLVSHNLKGVVLNNLDEAVPVHANLVNMSGKTSILEAVEILKQSQGYIGVDTSLAVLAAKKFTADRLLIKTTNAHVITWRKVYFAPHMNTSFLQLCMEIDTSKLLIKD